MARSVGPRALDCVNILGVPRRAAHSSAPQSLRGVRRLCLHSWTPDHCGSEQRKCSEHRAHTPRSGRPKSVDRMHAAEGREEKGQSSAESSPRSFGHSLRLILASGGRQFSRTEYRAAGELGKKAISPSSLNNPRRKDN